MESKNCNFCQNLLPINELSCFPLTCNQCKKERKTLRENGLKKCKTCKEIKNLDFFWKDDAACKNCNSQKKAPYAKNYYLKNREAKLQYGKDNRHRYKEKRRLWASSSSESVLFQSTKYRAKRDNLPFDLSLEDIIIPEYCPILGIKLEKNNKNNRDSSPSVDKIIPELGYIKTNIVIISYRANRIKNDATINELEQIYLFYKNILNK